MPDEETSSASGSMRRYNDREGIGTEIPALIQPRIVPAILG